MNSKQLKAAIRAHKGPIYADVSMRDDTITVRVYKADILSQIGDGASAPMYFNVHDGMMFLHASTDWS